MTGTCECGCGEATPLARQTDTKTGYVKGQPIRFVNGHQGRGRSVIAGGYRKVGLRLAHVLIAEQALGRALRGREEVHHADGNSLNNTKSNLVICPSRAYHMLLHARARVIRAGGNPATEKICKKCGQVKPLDGFYRFALNASSQRHSFCKSCDAVTRKTRKGIQ